MGGSGEIRINIYTLSCVNQELSGKWLYSTESSAQCSVMTERGGVGGRWQGDPGGRDKCILIADTFCCTGETKTAL